LAVAVGGAIGASARYEITKAVHITAGTFPWATFWINVAGCLAIGVLLARIADRTLPRALLVTGVLGAFTTFSTFAVDGDLLIKDGHAPIAVTYLGASILVGLAAVWAGKRVAS
jgi:CrcB protein